MPQPNKKRGRRMEGKKRKHDEAPDESDLENSSSKRRKSAAIDTEDPLEAQHELEADSSGPVEKAFFGILDEEEQEYFKHADDLLEANAFADADERDLFLASVYREADGKELKIAQSQSCSRLMERLIQLSAPAQLKKLFQAFGGNFIHLITHRFASHCCEALFLRASPAISAELLAPHAVNGSKEDGKDVADGNVDVPMETFFLDTLAEIRGSVGYLLTDPYASHVLRVILLVISGEPVDKSLTKRLLQSKRKEATSIQGLEQSESKDLERSRSVPESFDEALQQLIAESIAGLDTDKLRALATHPNGNPTLQLLLKLELTHFGKQRAKDETSVIRTLLPDDPLTADCDSAMFINALIYDPVGSHLVERIVEHAPGKMFKSLYHQFFREKLASHARNEVAGYVVCRVLERLGHDDLLEAHELLIPHITNLLQRNRTVVVRTLIERCTIRDIDTQAIAVQVDNTWHGVDGFEVRHLVKFGNLSASIDDASNDQQPITTEPPPSTFTRSEGSIKTHFNLLAQAMLLVPGSLSSLVLDSLVNLDPTTLLNMAKDTIVSRTLQTALTTRNASMIITRKLIQHFYGRIGEMALESSASHVVDCIWEGTHGLAFIRERIAEELAENEGALRASACGRAVWKNWKMDLYKRRRADWVRNSKVKASNDGFQSFSELDVNKEEPSSSSLTTARAADNQGGAGRVAALQEKKSPLQLARERHAKNKAKKKEEAEG